MGKKRLLLLIFTLIICCGFTACRAAEKTDNTDKSGITDEKTGEKSSDKKLKAPIIESWDVFGDTESKNFTAVISNPNGICADFLYDLVFCLNGTETGRIKNCSAYCLMPGQRDAAFINRELPDDFDEVKIDNVLVQKSVYEPVCGEYEYSGKRGTREYYDFEFDKAPTSATVWFILYYDGNGNGELDRGEISAVNSSLIKGQKGRASFDTENVIFTHCEIYFNAFYIDLENE